MFCFQDYPEENIVKSRRSRSSLVWLNPITFPWNDVYLELENEYLNVELRSDLIKRWITFNSLDTNVMIFVSITLCYDYQASGPQIRHSCVNPFLFNFANKHNTSVGNQGCLLVSPDKKNKTMYLRYLKDTRYMINISAVK